MKHPLTLIQHVRLVTMVPTDGHDPWGLVDDGAVLLEDGRLAAVGPRRDVQAVARARAGADVPVRAVDLDGALLGPGLVDAHTHLVYAGDRAAEFERRLHGDSYEAIARDGGGIRSTVAATRAADDRTLFRLAAVRARALMAEGVTTLEVKSGYGLTEAHEARCLAVARRLAEELPVSVRTTSLGAHALPPEFAGRPDAYIDAVCAWLPAQAKAGLVDAVDVFCEGIGFTPSQTERVFRAARDLGLPVKLHAEQLSNLEGAALAARHGALSADHLEHLSDVGIAAMRDAGTVAVLLPGAFYVLRETRLPPVAALRAAGVPMALATDHNPGTSPALSLLLMLHMGCTLFRLTPEEAFAGVTVHAARALGLHDRGRLAPGQRADLAAWDLGHPRELAWQFGRNPCIARWHAGVPDPAGAPR